MLNMELNESYKLDKAAILNKQIEDLRLADSKGDYTTTLYMENHPKPLWQRQEIQCQGQEKRRNPANQ